MKANNKNSLYFISGDGLMVMKISVGDNGDA